MLRFSFHNENKSAENRLTKLEKGRSAHFDNFDNPTIQQEYGLDNQGKKCRYNPYKLHISIPISYYDSIKKKIEKILYAATQQLVISSYKLLHDDGKAKLQWGVDLITSKEHDDIRKSFFRTMNTPFTLYLHNEVTTDNLEQLVQLCQSLETALIGVPTGKKIHLSSADLFVSEHITFRLTALDDSKKYISVGDGKDEELKQAGEKILYYTALKEQLSIIEKPENRSAFKCAIL